MDLSFPIDFYSPLKEVFYPMEGCDETLEGCSIQLRSACLKIRAIFPQIEEDLINAPMSKPS